jgi:hypothetical protein
VISHERGKKKVLLGDKSWTRKVGQGCSTYKRNATSDICDRYSVIVNKVTMATTVNTWSLASLLAPIHYQRVPTHINCVDTRPLYRQDTLPRKLVKKKIKKIWKQQMPHGRNGY